MLTALSQQVKGRCCFPGNQLEVSSLIMNISKNSEVGITVLKMAEHPSSVHILIQVKSCEGTDHRKTQQEH